MLGKEIEKKFLVRSTEFKNQAVRKYDIKQAYLCLGPDVIVRVRLRDNQGFLTVKSLADKNNLSVRNEWEKEISLQEAEDLFSFSTGKIIEKTRYIVPWQDIVIEVDEFKSPRPGLIIAEIEFPDEKSADYQRELPGWFGEEVTNDPQYLNVNLAKNG